MDQFPGAHQPNPADPHMPNNIIIQDRLLVEEIEEDVATWEEIKVTALFTMVTSLLFLLVFEYCRRKPSVAAVFDRRRSTKPTRTPPPLMTGPSGWRVFEWVFLSTDPAYLEYTAMVHEEAVIRERRRQRRCLDGEDGDDGEDDDDDNTRWFHKILPKRKRPTNIRRQESIESIAEEEMPQVRGFFIIGILDRCFEHMLCHFII